MNVITIHYAAPPAISLILGSKSAKKQSATKLPITNTSDKIMKIEEATYISIEDTELSTNGGSDYNLEDYSYENDEKYHNKLKQLNRNFES